MCTHLHCRSYFSVRQRVTLVFSPPQEITTSFFSCLTADLPTHREENPAGLRLDKSVLTGKEREFFMWTRGYQAQRVFRDLPSTISLRVSWPYHVEILQPTFFLPGGPGRGHKNLLLPSSPSVQGQSCIKSNFLLVRTGWKFSRTAELLINLLPSDGGRQRYNKKLESSLRGYGLTKMRWNLNSLNLPEFRLVQQSQWCWGTDVPLQWAPNDIGVLD